MLYTQGFTGTNIICGAEKGIEIVASEGIDMNVVP